MSGDETTMPRSASQSEASTVCGDCRAVEAPEQIQLADLLDRAQAFVTRYVVIGLFEAVAIALWIAHAWVLDAFDATGYLEIRSPVRRCGKSTLLDVLELLAPKPWKTIEPSEAVFYRRISASSPTLLLDEVDAIFNKKSESTEGLRACLNAGNKRGTTVPRCVPPKMEIAEFEVFCAKALAGIGGLPATITDRSIPIEMRRKAKTDGVERFRSRRAAKIAAPIVADFQRWAGGAVDAVEQQLLKIEGLADDGGRLQSLDDRAWEQAWEPLIAVASLAGPEWLDRGIAAAVALSGSRDDELDIGVNLLGDIRNIFATQPDRGSLATYELLDELLAIEDSPWRDWWSDPRQDDVRPSKAAPRKLARTLAPFGIRPADVWMHSGASRKGYRLEDFRDAWVRYLPTTDPRDTRDPRDANVHASLVPADHAAESARSNHDGRDPRGEPAQTEGSRAPRGNRASEARARERDEWLARDGSWRPLSTDPPAFSGEVIDVRPAAP
jgi:uncharacterized protein DUF3631